MLMAEFDSENKFEFNKNFFFEYLQGENPSSIDLRFFLSFLNVLKTILMLLDNKKQFMILIITFLLF